MGHQGSDDPQAAGGDGRGSLYVTLAAAFVRGHSLRTGVPVLPVELANPDLDALATDELERICSAGREAGLALHRFKRTIELQPVRAVISVLHGIAPASLLDVGTGRGTFLWPLLDAMPMLPVTAIDMNPMQIARLDDVGRGGVTRLAAVQMDATSLAFTDGQFDTVTLLEVLEHIPRPEAALAEAVRVAQRHVIVSVPSHADDNPEHIHTFSPDALAGMFGELGVDAPNIRHVRDHVIAVATLDASHDGHSPAKSVRLWVDDLWPAPDATWTIARTSAKAIAVLERGAVGELSLDYDLGGSDTAMPVVDWLDRREADAPGSEIPAWRIHSANPPGAARLRLALQALERRRDAAISRRRARR